MTYAANSTAIIRANAVNLFGVQYKDYHDERTMDHALVNSLYELLGPVANNLKDEVRSIGTPTFL